MSRYSGYSVFPRNDYVLLRQESLPEQGGLILTGSSAVDENVGRVVSVGPGNMEFCKNPRDLSIWAEAIAERMEKEFGKHPKKMKAAMDQMGLSERAGWATGCKGIEPGQLVVFLFDERNPENIALEPGIFLVREHCILAVLHAPERAKGDDNG